MAALRDAQTRGTPVSTWPDILFKIAKVFVYESLIFPLNILSSGLSHFWLSLVYFYIYSDTHLRILHNFSTELSMLF